MGVISDARRALGLYSNEDVSNLKLLVWIKAKELGIITRMENINPTLSNQELAAAWGRLMDHAIEWLDVSEEDRHEWKTRAPGSKYGLLSRMLQKWMKDKTRDTRMRIAGYEDE